MKRKVPSDMTPVIVGLLVVVIGSMFWNMRESFVSLKQYEAMTNSIKCKSDTDCVNGRKCVSGTCA